MREFSPLEFLAELQAHIPDIWEQTTRYYGQYSPRVRGELKKQNTAAFIYPLTAEKHQEIIDALAARKANR